MPRIYLEVDATDLNERLDRLQKIVTAENMERAVAKIFRQTASHVKRVLGKDIPPQYHVTSTEVRGAVGAPRISGRSCTIPIKGKRRSLGGSGYAIAGGFPGWNPPPYRITAKIVKSGTSTLPERAKSYGGQPPFRNTKASGGVASHAFTRSGKARLPIEKMAGIAIPQMPTNRSKPAVEADIMEFLAKKVEQRIQYELSKI